ncbi:MAG: PAS domain-containing sensor histidine kinase [bacterium]
MIQPPPSGNSEHPEAGANPASRAARHPGVFNEQVRLLYTHAPASMVAAAANSAILTIVLWNWFSPRSLLAWLAANLLLIGLRSLLIRWYRRRSAHYGSQRFWANLFIGGLALSGAVLGSAAIFFFPTGSLTLQVFLAFVLGGMVAGAAGAYSARLEAFLSYSIPTAAPIIARLLVEGGRMQAAMGCLAMLFCLIMLNNAFLIHRTIRTALGLRFENEGLIARLTATRKENESTLEKLKQEIFNRLRTEEALRLSEQKFSKIFQFSPIWIGIASLEQGLLIEVNEAFSRITGYDREEALGRTTLELGMWPDPQEREKAISILRQSQPLRNHEVDLRMKSGEIRTFLWSAEIIRIAGEPSLVSAFVDITERKRMEEALRKSEGKLRFLSSKLLSAQEEERKRLALELHDTIGAALTSVKYQVESIVAGTGAQIPERAVRSLEGLIPVVQHAIEDARRIYMDLRPSILDDLGIVATIHWHCKEYARLHPEIRVDQRIAIREKDVPGPLKIVILRILQEAMHNSAKHSRADRIFVALTGEGPHIRLSVEDNGQGFDPIEAETRRSPQSGLGLVSMRERAELSGGSFCIQSGPGKGTRIVASWPA